MTTTQPVDAIVARIREALEAGPTPGPWEWNARDEMFNAEDLQKLRNDRKCGDYSLFPEAIIQTDGGHYGPDDPTREYIASVSPDAIHALLAHMDGLKKDGEMLDWLLPKFSGKGLREAGIVYGGGVESIRAAIAVAMAEGADRG